MMQSIFMIRSIFTIQSMSDMSKWFNIYISVDLYECQAMCLDINTVQERLKISYHFFSNTRIIMYILYSIVNKCIPMSYRCLAQGIIFTASVTSMKLL